jgi:hypothetical protein
MAAGMYAINSHAGFDLEISTIISMQIPVRLFRADSNMKMS